MAGSPLVAGLRPVLPPLGSLRGQNGMFSRLERPVRDSGDAVNGRCGHAISIRRWSCRSPSPPAGCGAREGRFRASGDVRKGPFITPSVMKGPLLTSAMSPTRHSRQSRPAQRASPVAPTEGPTTEDRRWGQVARFAGTLRAPAGCDTTNGAFGTSDDAPNGPFETLNALYGPFTTPTMSLTRPPRRTRPLRDQKSQQCLVNLDSVRPQ